jgi:ProP effector
MEQKDKGSPLVTVEPSREPSNSPLNKPPESLPQGSPWVRTATDTLCSLRAKFPACFARLDHRSRQPLKLKIHIDILAAAPDIDPINVGKALKLYTGHVAYLSQCVEGKDRVDLDGKAAGSVTMQQAAYAAELMAKIRRKRRPTSPPASMAPSKKISFSDLKAAARKRAAMG